MKFPDLKPLFSITIPIGFEYSLRIQFSNMFTCIFPLIRRIVSRPFASQYLSFKN